MALTAELKRGGGERADVSVRARAFIPDWLKKRKKRDKKRKNIYMTPMCCSVWEPWVSPTPS